MNIKALCIADEPPNSSILDSISQNRPDVIITLGDLSLFDIRELDKVTDIPKIGVYGNHDSGNYMQDLGIHNLFGAPYELEGIKFVGMQGSIRYKSNPEAIMYTQDEAKDIADNLPCGDILISHSPPAGVHDHSDAAHQGLFGLNRYLSRCQPRYMLHGHTYVEPGQVTKYLDTEVFFVHAEMYLELVF